MKNLNYNKCYTNAIIAALFILGGTVAHAQLSLSYEEAGGGHNIGDVYTGPYYITFADFDMGTIYPTIPVGSSIGDGAGGTGTQSVAGGITTLNGAQTSSATGAQVIDTTINGVDQGAASAGTEDSWGIARVAQITDLSGRVVWSETGKNAQISVYFYGEKDFYLNQLNANEQEINGVGLHADFYYQSKSDVGYTPYNPDLGSAGRTATGYTTVTDGTLLLSTVSVPGFIHDPGVAGGVATEFLSHFNPNSGGDGQAYLSVTGGSAAAQFNTNEFTGGDVPGVTADLFAQFTTQAYSWPLRCPSLRPTVLWERGF
jgi:hypothetical protein